MGDVQKAEDLKAQAFKKANSSGGFFSFMSNPAAKFEEASNMYIQAGNIYKISKKWKEAGECFVEAAQLQLKTDVKHEAASQYITATNCYKKCDYKSAVQCGELAAAQYLDIGRLAMAAKQILNVADMYENQLVDLAKAMENYDKAADLFQAEDAASQANKAIVKVAHMAALLEDYTKGAEKFEEVGRTMAESSLLKWSAKEMFMKAALCRMAAGDSVDAERRIEEFDQVAAGFRDSREQKLVKGLLAALDEGEVDQYTQVVADYDAISPLDDWMTKILLTIKRTLDEDELR